MRQIYLGAFTKLPQGELPTYARNVVKLMTADAQFAPLSNAVAELKIRTEDFAQSLTENVNGGRLATLAKNKCKLALIAQLSELALLVDLQAKGDESVILCAGFDVRRPASFYTSLDAPLVLDIVNETTAGLATVTLGKVDGSTNYGIEKRIVVTGQPEGIWLNGDYSSACKFQFKGLESGKTYQFRFRAIGNKGLVSPFSSTVELLVS